MSLPCPECKGKTSVYATKRTGDNIVQYIQCPNCVERFKVCSEVKEVIRITSGYKQNLSSIMLEQLKEGDTFKTAPYCSVFWQVLKTKPRQVPVPLGFPEQWETEILAQSLKSSWQRKFFGSNLAVYVEVTK